MKYLLFVFMLAILTGCSTFKSIFSSQPEIQLKEAFDGNGIAVLAFSKNGSVSGSIGKLAADKLTDALFLVGKCNVIDRANVNEAQNTEKIENTESLSAENITLIGTKLNANYLVLGRVEIISQDIFLNSDSDKKINISFRIVSTKNAEILGVATYSKNYSGNVSDVIEEMMNSIVAKLKEI